MSWSTHPVVPKPKTGPIAWTTDPVAHPVNQQKGVWFARLQRIGPLAGSGNLGALLVPKYPGSEVYMSGAGQLSIVIKLKNWRNSPFNGRGLPTWEVWQIHRRISPFTGVGYFELEINDGLSAEIKAGLRGDFSGGGQFDFGIIPIGGHQYPDGLSALAWARYLYPAYFESEGTLLGNLGYFQVVLADLISSGQLSADVTALNGILADMVGDGSLSAGTFQIYETLAELLGTGELSASMFAAYLKSVGFRGASALVAIIMQSYPFAHVSGGIGTISALTKQIYTVTVDFSGDSYLWAEFEKWRRAYDDGLTADIAVKYVTQLVGDGVLTASQMSQLYSLLSDFKATGTLSADAERYIGAFPALADLLGSGQLSAAVDSGHHYTDDFASPEAMSPALTGGGSLSATVLRKHPMSANFSGTGTLSAIIAVPVRFTGTSYNQSNVFSGNTAATFAGMNNDNYAETTETGMNPVANNYIEAWLGSYLYVSHIIVGYDQNTLKGGWGPSYTSGLTVQVSDQSQGYINFTTTPSRGTGGLEKIPINRACYGIKILNPATAYMAITEFSVWIL